MTSNGVDMDGEGIGVKVCPHDDEGLDDDKEASAGVSKVKR